MGRIEDAISTCERIEAELLEIKRQLKEIEAELLNPTKGGPVRFADHPVMARRNGK